MSERVYLVQVNNRFGQNVYLPYSVGLLWAYARTFPEIAAGYQLGVDGDGTGGTGFLYLKEKIDVAVARLVEPQLLALSMYIWNAEWSKAFAQAVKVRWPQCKIVVGGVQVPDESPRILIEQPYFDFAIYGEGEGAFAEFLRERLKPSPDYSKCGSLIWRAGDEVGDEIQVNARRPFTDLAELRSPYLDGVFDGLWGQEPRWQILHETGTRGCPYASFSGDTIVALPDKLLRFDAEAYSSENTLPCPDVTHRHRVGTEDERVVAQGVRECLKLTFSNGLSLSLTAKHPMKVVRNEKIVDSIAAELVVGDWVPVEVGQNSVAEFVTLIEPSKTLAEQRSAQGFGQGRRCPNKVDLPKVLTEDVAWLTGYLIGDGCLPSDDRSDILFAVTDKVRQRLIDVVRKLFDLSFDITKACNTDEMEHGARKVVQFFRESLGMESIDRKLRVPLAILKSPAGVVRAFLEGLWAADEYQPNTGEPYLTTVSERLATDCAALIHWIGDTAVLRKYRPDENSRGEKYASNKFKHKEFIYRVEWHGQHCRERVYGKPCVASRVPAVRHTYRNKRGDLRLRHTPQQKIREGSPREVLRHFEPQHELLDDRFVFVQLKFISSDGLKEVFDVHNHPSHTVAANGVYVRQCSFCAWGQAAMNEVRQIPDERVREEIDWFGRRKADYIDGCDANFGLLKRDVDLTRTLAATKAKYGYPKTFRTSFAKNSNEVIWEIANILHEAQMLKSVTLAMQSMDDDVLVNIKRKNIKFSKFGDLVRRYEAAGIPTYTELILGLPGETISTFLDGIDKNLEAGQHSGLFCYLNIMLENTEQRHPEYIAAHGLETVRLQAMLTHGTPDDGIREVQETVVGTAAMPHEDWRRAYLHSKVIEVFHSQGLLQATAIALRETGTKYREFYSALIEWMRVHPETIAGSEFAALERLLDRALSGGSWDCVDPRLGEISWPPEEFMFARICCELERFYDEISAFVPITAEQRVAIDPPEPGNEVEWAREVVWYGRKGRAKMLRKKSA